MTEPTTEPAGGQSAPGSEVSTYVRVADPPDTVREGQGTGDRAGGRAGEGPDGGGPRAGGARATGARDRIIARTLAVTQRQHAVKDSRLGQTVRDLAAGALDDLGVMWRYVRGETWMRDSDNTILRICGYLWAVAVALPVVAVMHLVATAAALAADVVVLVFSRYARGIAALAIAAAVWWVWPFNSHEPAPPSAATEIVLQGGAR